MQSNAVVQRRGPHTIKPSAEWLDRFLKHVKATGQPEAVLDLDWSRPPAWSKPHILTQFDVDRKKRPEGDMAPCAVCSPRRPKCLNGLLLVWYELEAVVRVIGPDCGTKIEGGEALRGELKAYKLRLRKERAEAFLEAQLPLVAIRIAALEALRPATKEADRLYRKLRADNNEIAKCLRQQKRQHAGQLTVDVPINTTSESERDRDGPRGFGRGVDTFTESFGPLAGEAMFAASFRPLEELNHLLELANALPRVEAVEDTFDWLVENEGLAIYEDIECRIREIDARRGALISKLDSVVDFFSRDHFARLNAWGQHRCGRFELSATAENGIFSLCHRDRPARFKPDFDALTLRPASP
jgi:hypothetical protein